VKDLTAYRRHNPSLIALREPAEPPEPVLGAAVRG
jgi:hypothetical protein